MRISGRVLGFLIVVAAATSAQAQKKALPAPIHPDTLPTLKRGWKLPASLAPLVTNAYSSRMTLDGDRLFVFDHHGRRLVAVDAKTGKVLWHKPVPSVSNRTFAFTPLVTKGPRKGRRVYVANDGTLYCYDTADGSLKWKVNTKGIGVNGLARSKHRVYLPWIKTAGNKALATTHLWAIDSRRARVEWNKKFPGKMAFLGGDAAGVYYVGDTGVVLGLTPDRGGYLWKLRIKGRVTQQPILKGNKLFITSLRKKAGWKGTGVYVIDVKKGKLLWQTKLAYTMVAKFLVNKKLVTVESDGRLTAFDDAGKKLPGFPLDLKFGSAPTSLHGVAVGTRAFIFSSHRDGNGFVRLVDMDKKKMMVTANALDMKIRSLITGARMLYFDGQDGDVYAYSLASRRPRRGSVPPMEFAKEMLDRVADTRAPVTGLAPKLAGLGTKALPAIEPALESPNPYVVDVAARAIGLVGNRKSVPALIQAVSRLVTTALAPGAKADPLLAVIEALAALRAGRAVPVLKTVMKDTVQNHMRRRAAYVALGTIGTPVSLAPIWPFRASKAVKRRPAWAPQAQTLSTDYQVEKDETVTPQTVSPKLHKATTQTVQTKDNKVHSATLSPYLGGYNDIWVGPSDLAGVISRPMFTGLTKAEIFPNRRIRLAKFKVSKKGKISIRIQMKAKKRWVTAKPVMIDQAELTADMDGDGLSDLVERRLHLCVTNKDCDGDGISDAVDVNPLASGKQKLTVEQRLFREAFFTYFAFLKRRGIVVVDPGDGPSFELFGRLDPILSLRRPTIERLRKQVGLHAIDYVSFGGPYPERSGSGDALKKVQWNRKRTRVEIGMDIFRSGENAVAYNVTLKKVGKRWVVHRFFRVWTTNE